MTRTQKAQLIAGQVSDIFGRLEALHRLCANVDDVFPLNGPAVNDLRSAQIIIAAILDRDEKELRRAA